MMKRLLIMLCAMVFLVGCGNSKELENMNASLSAQVESLTAEVESVSAEKESLSKDIEGLNKDKASLQAQVDRYKKAEEEAKKEVTVQPDDVEVVLVSKSVTPKDSSNWIFYDYVDFVFEVRNNTDKDIQGVEGTAVFKDIFGKTIKTMGGDFTGKTIPAHDAAVFDELSFECNQFQSDDMKLFSTDFNDLKMEYTVTSIVFTDGTVKK